MTKPRGQSIFLLGCVLACKSLHFVLDFSLPMVYKIYK